MRRYPPQLWLRILMPFVFFVGGAGLIFWAQGFRFDFTRGGFVSTGVLSVETAPPTFGAWVEGVYRGTTPGVFLGVPLGAVEVCLRKNEYLPYCGEDFVDARSVTFWHNVFMLPSNLRARDLGPAEQFLWDPLGRGYVRHFPDLAVLMVRSPDGIRFIEDITPATEFFLTPQGRLVLVQDEIISLDVFAGLPPPSGSQLFPDGQRILFHSDGDLFLRSTEAAETERLASFGQPIETVFFLPDSESILVYLPGSIRFLHRPEAPAHRLFEKKDGFRPVFFPGSAELYWEDGGRAYSFDFLP